MSQEGKIGRNTEILMIILLLALGLSIIYIEYALAGPQWDLVVRSLMGKTVVNFFTHKISPQAAFIGEFQDNLLYYYEPYREPVSILIFALLSVFFQNTILPYLLLMFFFYSLAIYMFSKQMRINTLIAFVAFLNGYTIYYLFLPNGGEVLASIFVLLGLILLFRKSPLSGLFFALAMLSKYPAIVFLSLVLFLGDRKKIAKALALEAIILLMFMGFDYFIYGNPIYSFTESIANSNTLSTSSSIDIWALAAILAYPVITALIGAAALALKRQKLEAKLGFRAKLIICMIALSVIEAIVIIPHNNFETQARYGFLVELSLLFPAALILDSAAKRFKNLKYTVAIIAALALIVIACVTYIMNTAPNIVYYNPNNSNGIYAHAGAELTALGYGNCRFTTNTWPDMLYIGYDAYSPFSIYKSPVITPVVEEIAAQEGINYTQYQNSALEEPILVFKYDGVSKYSIINLNQSRLVYNDQNISIYIPENVTCKDN